MRKVLVKCPAKINVYLDIKGKREDGYHELDMIMLPLELHDSILVNELPHAPESYITSDDFVLYGDKDNIVDGVLEAFQNKFNIKKSCRVFIHKNIPIQAGLGGGSSDAAGALRAFAKLFKITPTEDELYDIAKKVGSDVPFFLYSKPARCSGRGEIVEPIDVKDQYYCLLVKPEKGCSTKGIYNLSDSFDIKCGNINDVLEALKNGDDELLKKSMHNTLEEAAISQVPEIQDIKNKLYELGFDIVQMSGSGSTVFGLTKNVALAKKAERALENKYYACLTKTTK